MQARSTERRWSRALQHEHTLRLQLQENMEALANQMHGLEDEARLSVQGILPSLHNVSSHSSTAAAETSSELPGNRDKKPMFSAAASPYSPEKDFTETVDGSDSDDEDKFFDAPEMSTTDWTKSKQLEQVPGPSSEQQQATSVGHRRSFSTASVNDTSSMICASNTDVKEKLPQISSDRRMAVSWACICSPFPDGLAD